MRVKYLSCTGIVSVEAFVVLEICPTANTLIGRSQSHVLQCKVVYPTGFKRSYLLYVWRSGYPRCGVSEFSKLYGTAFGAFVLLCFSKIDKPAVTGGCKYSEPYPVLGYPPLKKTKTKPSIRSSIQGPHIYTVYSYL